MDLVGICMYISLYVHFSYIFVLFKFVCFIDPIRPFPSYPFICWVVLDVIIISLISFVSFFSLIVFCIFIISFIYIIISYIYQYNHIQLFFFLRFRVWLTRLWNLRSVKHKLINRKRAQNCIAFASSHAASSEADSKVRLSWKNAKIVHSHNQSTSAWKTSSPEGIEEHSHCLQIYPWIPWNFEMSEIEAMQQAAQSI